MPGWEKADGSGAGGWIGCCCSWTLLGVDVRWTSLPPLTTGLLPTAWLLLLLPLYDDLTSLTGDIPGLRVPGLLPLRGDEAERRLTALAAVARSDEVTSGLRFTALRKWKSPLGWGRCEGCCSRFDEAREWSGVDMGLLLCLCFQSSLNICTVRGLTRGERREVIWERTVWSSASLRTRTVKLPAWKRKWEGHF